ncbi:AAA family ATPase [Planctomicrobium sp. SH527]|uniref:AAA family ATPase n=1 Tax=Planctomicrobium sp. SH527 TaxID=3448123 RepID=UPI003F5C9048
MSEIDAVLRSLGFNSRTPGSDSANLPHYDLKQDYTDPLQSSSTFNGVDAGQQYVSSAMTLLQPSADEDVPVSPHRPTSVEKSSPHSRFMPTAPETLPQAGLHPREVSDLLLKTLAVRGIESGYNISKAIGLRFPLVERVLRQLKIDRLVSYRNSAAGGDYLYELTEHGRERAVSLSQICAYLGTAPVSLSHYIASVQAQAPGRQKPTLAAIREAFRDLLMEEDLISGLGQAIHSGRGMFLYGPAGNGKTSIAERVTKSFGDTIWIPRSISSHGEIIRLFDPNRHKPVPTNGADHELMDGRWIQIERPTIVAGGELRMENLEINYIRTTGVGEAPLQMKANCGTLLIDDFGRQRMRIDELLNRWIVPLEHRYDYLHLESGRSIQVPFEELLVFSTNLQPRDLVDEAFLRRIPYKIEVKNPSEATFRRLFKSEAAQRQVSCPEEMIDYLVDTHYRQNNRSFRNCHPRDLLRQIENRCSLHEMDFSVTREALDEAVSIYFSIMCETPA